MKRDSLNRLRTLMCKNQREIGKILASIKYRLHRDISISTLINNIFEKKLGGYSYIFKGMKVDNIENLHTTSYIPFVTDSDIMNELNWATEIILKYGNEVNFYLHKKEEYEEYFLIGDYIEAERINNEIERKCTFSLWGIQNNFLLKQLINGFEDNRTYLSSISNANADQLVNVLADFYSYKADPESSCIALRSRVEDFLSLLSDEGFYFQILDRYIRYKLLFQSESININDISIILSFEETMSIIDYYNTFIDLVKIIISNKLVENDKLVEIKGILYRLRGNVDEKEIDNILLLLDLNICKDIHNDSYVRFIEMYTVGSYEVCEIILKENINQLCTSFEIMQIWAKCNIFLGRKSYTKVIGENCFFDRISELIMAVYICDSKRENLIRLENYMNYISNLDIVYGLLYFIKNQSLYYLKDDKYEKLAFFSLKEMSPIWRNLFIGDNKTKYLEVLEDNWGYKYTGELFRNINNKNTDDSLYVFIPKHRYLYYKYKILYEVDKDSAIRQIISNMEDIEQFKDNSIRYYKERLYTLLFYLYINTGQYFRAMEVLVNSFMEDESYIVRMNKDLLKNEIDKLDENSCNKYYCSTKWPIFNYIINNKDYYNMYTSLFKFLEVNAMEAPLEIYRLIRDENQINKEEILFILEKMYSFNVMKNYVFFDVKQRYSFRIGILNFLKEYNVGSKKKYDDEIKNLTYQQGIKEKMKTINQKRIYVDIGKIIEENGDLFKSKFKRFLALKNIEVSLNCTDIYSIDKIILEVADNIKKDSEVLQKYALLKEIVIEFNKEFIYNPNYGLDKFLSTRIRHGMLESYLLKPFNKYYLISSTDGVDLYQINRYWDERISLWDRGKSKIDYAPVIQAVDNFSKKISDKINECINWIRISSRDHAYGMFKYQCLLENDRLMVLYNALDKCMDYDIFYQTITDLYLAATDSMLKEIRYRFENEVKAFFISCLDELYSILDQEKKNYDYRSICNEMQNNIIACKTRIKNDIESVCNWFYIRKDNECEDYTIDEIANIIVETNNKLSRENELINVDLTGIKDNNIVFDGDTFISMWDILTILYTNACSTVHTGFRDTQDIRIVIYSELVPKEEIQELIEVAKNQRDYEREEIEAYEEFLNEDAQVLNISVKNNLSSDIDKEKLESTIKDKFQDMQDSEKSKKMIFEEGGSGLIKLNNTLKNMEIPYLITYELQNDSVTFGIYMEISKIRLEEN